MDEKSNIQETNDANNTKKFKFLSLAPDDTLKDLGNYDIWLNDVINNNKIGNIAITGDLGIGKSSIIRTFERQNKFKFIYISANDLAYIQNEEETESNKEKQSENITQEKNDSESNQVKQSKHNKQKTVPSDSIEQSVPKGNKEELSENKSNEVIQKELEKNLLIQLIAICQKKDIPYSRFKTVPENPSRIHKFVWTLLYPLFTAITVLCIFKYIFRGSLPDFIPNFSFDLIQFIIFALYLGLNAFGIVRIITKNYKLPKLSYKMTKGNHEASAEFDQREIEPEGFDSNIHEIIYMIEQLGNKLSRKGKNHNPILVIEDLDRYPGDICIPILTKLKLINDMLNQRHRQNHLGYGKRFKFIYVIKDAIFVDENNTRNISENDPYKFFDVVIPVIPKLGLTNSSETIKKLFNSYSIDDEFINAISLFIYDYRKLSDIQNEFYIYHKQFSHLKNKNDTQLLAFIIYKVIYPEDYYELYKTYPKTNVPKSNFLKKALLEQTTTESTKDPFKDYLQSKIDDSLLIFMNFSERMKVELRAAIIKKEKFEILKNINLMFAQLNKTDLSDTNLSGANLSGADLSDANLSGANLYRANLTNAKLTDADLICTLLISTNLSGAHLSYANLLDTDLSGANLSGAHLSCAKLRNANLSNANLSGADLSGANLSDANLSGVNLSGTYLSGANLFGVNLSGANLSNADLFGVNLSGAKLTGTDLRNTNVNHVTFNSTTFFMIKLLKSDLPKYNDYVKNGNLSINNPIIFEDNNSEEYYSYIYDPINDSFKLEDTEGEEPLLSMIKKDML